MPIVVRQIRIEAPPDRVWAVLADVSGQPRWMRDLVEVRLIDDEPVGVGSRAVGAVRMFGLTQIDPIEVTAFEPPARYAVAHLGGFIGSGEFRLRPLDDGRATHVWWREELRPTPGVVPGGRFLFRMPAVGGLAERVAGRSMTLLDPLFAPVFELVFRADLRRLKRLVETGAP